ncbi:MAG: hypothetical protein UX78_C0010G0002 [Candidatus Amesbacteria bacterium GW2011_GWA2_47_11]|uniref:Uncharacterized protein n=1 Tax=Candidatus Amesbacteria bacterium GW2011_GWA2_47_11 TaxID=1618357 RepID=A0A0G1RG48_9BACT|nr:MAG: hypothetical protein UX78_C0010G0002 [Candidatus Amesbacteria bacterium GW2011_GWA2_47_11]
MMRKAIPAPIPAAHLRRLLTRVLVSMLRQPSAVWIPDRGSPVVQKASSGGKARVIEGIEIDPRVSARSVMSRMFLNRIGFKFSISGRGRFF